MLCPARSSAYPVACLPASMPVQQPNQMGNAEVSKPWKCLFQSYQRSKAAKFQSRCKATGSWQPSSQTVAIKPETASRTARRPGSLAASLPACLPSYHLAASSNLQLASEAGEPIAGALAGSALGRCEHELSLISPEETPNPRKDSEKTGRSFTPKTIIHMVSPCILAISFWVWSLFWGIVGWCEFELM